METAEEVPFDLIRLVAAICLLMATTPRAVFGVGPITTVWGTSDTNSDDKKQAVATCPPGTIAFSGGVSTHPVEPFSGELAVVHSAPTGDPPTEWVVMAQEMIPADENWFVQAYAHCAEIPGYKSASAGSAFTSDDYKSIDVSCPPDTKLTGGGSFIIAAPSQAILLTANHPDGNGWAAQAIEFSPTGAAWILGVKVNCAPAPDLDVISANLTRNTGVAQGVVLSCAPHRFAVGGGWKFYGILGMQGLRNSRSGVIFSHHEAWEVISRSLSPGAELDLTAYALCLSSEIFSDGFEFGNTVAWSRTVQ